jgi:hypothetical protein
LTKQKADLLYGYGVETENWQRLVLAVGKVMQAA